MTHFNVEYDKGTDPLKYVKIVKHTPQLNKCFIVFKKNIKLNYFRY